MNKSCKKWKSLLTDLGHPNVSSWDNQNLNAALFRVSKERQDLLNWLAPKILECSGSSKQFPDQIALEDVYSQFVCILEEEMSSFISGSLLKDKQVEIWSNIFWKIDQFRGKAGDTSPEVIRLPEDQALLDRAQRALIKAEEVLSKPLPRFSQNGVPPEENCEVVSVDALLRGINRFYEEAKLLDVDPAAATLDADLTTLKTLSEMAAAMKRMNVMLPTTT